MPSVFGLRSLVCRLEETASMPVSICDIRSFFTPKLVIWFLVFVGDAKGSVNVVG
jgi:hypothetical protein